MDRGADWVQCRLNAFSICAYHFAECRFEAVDRSRGSFVGRTGVPHSWTVRPPTRLERAGRCNVLMRTGVNRFGSILVNHIECSERWIRCEFVSLFLAVMSPFGPHSMALIDLFRSFICCFSLSIKCTLRLCSRARFVHKKCELKTGTKLSCKYFRCCSSAFCASKSNRNVFF